MKPVANGATLPDALCSAVFAVLLASTLVGGAVGCAPGVGSIAKRSSAGDAGAVRAISQVLDRLPVHSPDSISAQASNDVSGELLAGTAGSDGRPPPPGSVPDFGLDVVDVPVAVFFRALSSLAGVDMVLDSGLQGKISLRMDAVSWHRLTRTAASQLGLHANFHAAEPLVRVQAAACSDQSCARQQVSRLRYADAEAIAGLLRQSAQQSGETLSAVAEKAGNRLVLSGSVEAVEAASALAQRLDTRRALILVELWILETSDERSRLLGLDLGLEDNGRSSAGGLAGSSEFNLLRQGPVGDGAALIGRLNRERLSLRLATLEQDGFTRILSNPRIYAMDGESAEVFQGDEVPYTVRGENGSSHTEFRQAGLRLQVLPRLLAGGEVSLQLHISKDTVDRSRASPPISRREMRTQLVLRQGDAAIIGGITAEGESGRRSGAAPFGSLIGSGEGQSGSARLLMVLAVSLVRPGAGG